MENLAGYSDRYISMAVGGNAISGAIFRVNEKGKLEEEILLDTRGIDDTMPLKDQCISYVLNALGVCSKIKYDKGGRTIAGIVPVAIGVSSKGQVVNGVINPGKPDEFDIKSVLEAKCSIQTEVLNRFHAAALGIATNLNGTAEGRTAVITLSSGVGSGVVYDGRVEESYSPEKGTGGLIKVTRYSDFKELTIAQIAGIKEVERRLAELGGGTIGALLKEATVELPGAIPADISHAVAALVEDIKSNSNPERIIVLPYSGILGRLEQEKLVGMIAQVTKTNVENARIGEREAKLLGAAAVAKQRKDMGIAKTVGGEPQRPRIIAISGPPGAGKSYGIQKAIEQLREKGLTVGGVLTREESVAGTRTGFRMVNIATGEEAVLARIGPPEGDKLRIGNKYNVEEQNVQGFAASAIRTAMKEADVIIIDEVGPMQLLSKGYDFKDIVIKALMSGKPCILSIKYDSSDTFVERIKRDETTMIVFASENARERSLARFLDIVRGVQAAQPRTKSTAVAK